MSVFFLPMNNAASCFPVKALLALVLLLAASTTFSTSAGFDDAEIKHIEYPDWFSDDPFSDLAEQVEKARSEGKKGLMVLFTTEGCSYCYLFVSRSLGDQELASRVQRDFEAVGLEIFDDREMTTPDGQAMPIKAFADREGAEFAPTLLYFGLDGRRVLKLVGYQSPERFGTILDYVSGGHFSSQTLREYIARTATEAPKTAASREGLRDDPLFVRPPYNLERRTTPASRPLLVIFEKADCAECDTFHSRVLADKEVRETLGRFDVVRLDAADDSTRVVDPQGHTVTPASWYAALGFSRVPALMFFEESGMGILETDALVLEQRMMNSLNYVLERAYEQGWTYQRFARSKAIARWEEQQQSKAPK